MKVRVTKEFTFEMAHALYRYDGKCENVHGHTYHLAITIIGKPEFSAEDVKCGMVMDFSDLKMLVKDQILDRYDHALVLNENDSRINTLAGISTKLIATPFQPTCENLIIDFVERLQPLLSGSAELFSIKLRETPASFAEWFSDDNKEPDFNSLDLEERSRVQVSNIDI